MSNYKTANGWTKQTIIDKINSDFKGKAFNLATAMCEYSTADGRKCAIGLFIPKDHLAIRYSGDVKRLLIAHIDLRHLMPFENDNILLEFQTFHDNLSFNDSSERQKDQLIQWVEFNVI